MFGSTVRRTAVVAVVLAGFTVSCGGDPAEPAAKPGAAAPAAPTASSSASPAPSTPSASPAPGRPVPGASSRPSGAPSDVPPSKVRDAFAGLQATLNDSCTPGNCAYFLGRVHDELHRMDVAMKADPKGPGHFPEPIALIAKLDEELGGDRSFENLKKHQTLLIGTRDKINTWMQGHPDDYR
ncbi:hypothetical protein ACIGFK_15380 [Streptomyces sp. NPDC085524]|uniref:hypothetical protein n=1 Tax=unclassified Streptomyces TaxID=2593676 RepID=UPI0035E16ECD